MIKLPPRQTKDHRVVIFYDGAAGHWKVKCRKCNWEMTLSSKLAAELHGSVHQEKNISSKPS